MNGIRELPIFSVSTGFSNTLDISPAIYPESDLKIQQPDRELHSLLTVHLQKNATIKLNFPS